MMQTVDLAHRLLAEIWIDLAQERATGTLRLVRGHVRKSLAFLDGSIVGAESTLAREALTAQLLDSGDLTESDCRKVEAAIVERGCTEAAALAGLKLLEPAQLLDAMRGRIERCALESLAWQSGEARFDPDTLPSADARRLRCDTLALAHRGAALHVCAERLGGLLTDSGHLYATLAEGRDGWLRGWIDDDAVALRLLRALDGNHRFELAVGAAYQQPRALAALWIAERIGALDFAEAPRKEADDEAASVEVAPDIEIEVVETRPRAREPAKSRSSASPAAAPRDLSGETEELRKAVAKLHAELGEANHYEMLGLDAGVHSSGIKKAYFSAAKRFHPDKLARLGLEDVRAQAAEVFAALAEANEVLSDAARRKDYDDRLAGGDVADVDVARLAQAEGFFRKSEVLAKMGDFRGASELLASAVQLWPEESEYHAALGFARFKKKPADLEGARSSLEIAIDLRAENTQAHMWLSLVLRASGDVNGSARHAQRARELDPNVS